MGPQELLMVAGVFIAGLVLVGAGGWIGNIIKGKKNNDQPK